MEEVDDKVEEKKLEWNRKGKHKKDDGRPDSNDPNCTVDFWKQEEFKPGDMKGGPLVEESSFVTLFPQYREKYLQEVCCVCVPCCRHVSLLCLAHCVLLAY